MTIKSGLKIIGFIIAFLISSIIILAFIVDANVFKPRLQSIAADHGIALEMRGDLHWAYWPALGLAVNDVSIADINAPQAVIANIKKASFLIAFFPLMRGDFQVKHVLVDGAAISLSVNEQGVGNWENILNKKQETAGAGVPVPQVPSTNNDLKLSIQKVGLHNSAITYIDNVKGSQFSLTDIRLDVEDVNLKSTPFDLDASWKTEIKQKNNPEPLLIKTTLHSSMALSDDINAVTMDKGELQLTIGAKGAANIKAQYSLRVDDLKNTRRYQGKLVVPTFNAKQLLAVFGTTYKAGSEKSLTELSFTSDIIGDKKQLALSALKLQIDKTLLEGSIVIKDFATQDVAVELAGDKLTINDYLPLSQPTQTSAPTPAPTSPAPQSPGSASAVTASVAPATATAPIPASPTSLVAATGNEPLVPVALVRKLNAAIKLSLNSFVFSNMHLEKVLLDVNARHGLVQLSINANAYNGGIHVKNTLDARQDTPQLRFETVAKDIALAPLLKDKGFDQKIQLSGRIQANLSAQASGASRNNILDSLTGNFNFSGDDIRLAPLNIEEQFCKLVNLVNQEPSTQTTWNNYTELQKLSGKATIAKRVITVENLNSNVKKLSLGIQGTLNLMSGTYDFMLPIKLNRDATDTPTSVITSAQGCKVSSNYWVERSMTLLRCKGVYAQMDPSKDCRPDKEQLNSLLKDFAAYKLKEKHGEKIEEKKAELLKKLDEKLGGEGKAEKTKDLLKSLFKKKEEKR